MMEPSRAIDMIAAELRGRQSIQALFLSGSHGVGLQDAYSDIDFVLVTSEGLTDEIAALCQRAISMVGEIVLWRDRQVRPMLINAILKNWMRVDVIVLKPDQLASQKRDSLKVVFDVNQLSQALSETSETKETDRRRMRFQFEEFIRILGLLPLAIGREEYLNGISGVFHLRNLLVDLMIEETRAPHRGGALHLNRLITAEQKEVLRSLPMPLPERDSVIAVNLAYAEAYLPRARRLARRWSVEWPEPFEAATWMHLNKKLGSGPIDMRERI